MKNSVLILGIALISFSNICNAKNTINLSNNLFQNFILSDDNDNKEINNSTTRFKAPSFVEDLEVYNPETVIAYNPKTVKDIIAEGDKIIDKSISDDTEFMDYEESMKRIITQFDLIIENNISNETYSLYCERTVENEITELELIIDSTKMNEVIPLDFKKINNAMIHNSFNAKKYIGMN